MTQSILKNVLKATFCDVNTNKHCITKEYLSISIQLTLYAINRLWVQIILGAKAA